MWCHGLVHFTWYKVRSAQSWELGDTSSCERPGSQRFSAQGPSSAEVDMAAQQKLASLGASVSLLLMSSFQQAHVLIFEIERQF